MTRVAVIIPTYNRAALLRRAISSVTAQTYRDLEIVVVDDGSTDDTASICEGLRNVKYIRLNHSGLPAVARNAGIAASNSDLIAFLDSDDEWLPDKLQVQLSAFNENVSFVCSDAIQIGGRETEGVSKDTYHRAIGLSPAPSFDYLLKQNFVIASTAVVRRSILERTGSFSENAALRGLEDYDLWLRIAAAAPLVYMPAPLIRYRFSDDGLSRNQSSIDHWAGILHIFRYLRKLSELAPSQREALETEINRCWSTLCDACILQGNYLMFGQSFARYFSNSPSAAISYLNGGLRKVWNR